MTAEEFVRFVDSPDRLIRQLRTAAAISERLQPLGIVPVVVGGAAVEFYTRGSYTTVDVDMVVEGLNEIDAVLRGFGFVRLAGSSYIHPSVEVVVDLPAEPLAGDTSRIVELDVEGRKVHIIGLEDIIADRLRAYVYWEDLSSQEWAVQMMAARWEQVDSEYLDTLASDEPPIFALALAQCRRLAQAVVRSAPPDARGGTVSPIDSGYALSTPVKIAAGTRGVDRASAVDILAERLLSSAQEVTLVVDDFPFRGQGASLLEAQQDLLAAIEETLDELEADVLAGVSLSPNLERTLRFARQVFGAQAER